MRVTFLALLQAGLCMLPLSANALVGIGFSAPNVDGTANVGNAQIGDIIFDTNNNTFAGYGGTTPGWLILGAAASPHAPTTSVATPSSHSGGFDGSGTYVLPTSPTPLYIRVRMVGGGGSGGGTPSSSPGAGSAGGNTTFGSSLLVANGGGGGSFNLNGGAGGDGLVRDRSRRFSADRRNWLDERWDEYR